MVNSFNRVRSKESEISGYVMFCRCLADKKNMDSVPTLVLKSAESTLNPKPFGHV